MATSSGEHPITINGLKFDKSIATDLFPDGVALQISGLHAKLGCDELYHWCRDDVLSGQQAAGIVKDAKLASKPKSAL
jgi:hypothetical protein